MKKFGIIVFVVAVVVGVALANFFSFGRISGKLFNVSVGFGKVSGSGTLASEKRSVSEFRSIDVSSVFHVDVVLGKEYSVEVEADDNLIKLIQTEVRGGTLKIELDKRVSTKNDLRVRVTAPDVERIDVSGVAHVNVSGINNETFSVDASGASRIKLNGNTISLDVDVSGACHVEAAELVAEKALVDASGAARVSVNVSDQLNADASGAANISYTGNPGSIQKDTSGAGSVTQN